MNLAPLQLQFQHQQSHLQQQQPRLQQRKGHHYSSPVVMTMPLPAPSSLPPIPIVPAVPLGLGEFETSLGFSFEETAGFNPEVDFLVQSDTGEDQSSTAVVNTKNNNASVSGNGNHGGSEEGEEEEDENEGENEDQDEGEDESDGNEERERDSGDSDFDDEGDVKGKSKGKHSSGVSQNSRVKKASALGQGGKNESSGSGGGGGRAGAGSDGQDPPRERKKPGRKPKILDDETKKMRGKMRQEKNRVAARKCREKKQGYFVLLEEEVIELRRVKEEMATQIASLKQELQHIQNRLDSRN